MIARLEVFCIICFLIFIPKTQAQEKDSIAAKPLVLDFNQGHVFSLPQAIQGQVPGVMISRPGANPNEPYDVIYRGYNTYIGRTAPLLLLDGIPGLPWQFADPFLFDSLHVRQGASAVRMGMQAGAGVFDAAQRRPTKQGLSVRFVQSATMEHSQRPYETLSSAEFRANAPLGTTLGNSSTDWLDLLTTTAGSSHTGMHIGYQQERLKSRVALSNRSVNGIQPGSGFDQLSLYGGLDYSFWEEKISVGGSALLVNREAALGDPALFEAAIAMNPTLGAGEDVNFFTTFGRNPYESLQQNNRDLETNVRMWQTYMNLQLVQGWNINAKVGEMRTEHFQNQLLSYPPFFSQEVNFERYDTRQDGRKYFEASTSYEVNLGTLKITPDIRYSSQQINYASDGFFEYTYFQPGFDNVFGMADDIESGTYGLGAWTFSMQAAIQNRTQINVVFQSEKAANVGAQVGRGSFFGVDVRQQLMPHWYMLGSYTHTGLNPGRTGLSQTQVQTSSSGFGRQLHLANPQLKWEDTQQWEVGTGGTWLKEKLQGEVRFFVRSSADFVNLLQAHGWPFSPYNSYYPYSYQNFGAIQNRGMEWTVALSGIQMGELRYSSGIQASFMTSKWTDLEASFTSLEDRLVTPARMVGSGSFYGMHQLRAGEQIGTMQAPTYAGIDRTTGDWILGTPNNPYTGSLESSVPHGQGVPRWHMGWNHQLQWRKWRFDMMLRGVFGHSNFNETSFRYGTVHFANANRVTSYRELSQAGLTAFNTYNSYFIEPSGFVSLHYASIARDVDIIIGSHVLRSTISLIGNNLFFLTKYSGADPEARLKTLSPSQQFALPNTSSFYFAPGIDAVNTWLPSRAFTLALSVNI